MSNYHVNPSDNSGANRNLNNYVAKQVVAKALGLNTEQGTMANEQAEASRDTLALGVDTAPSPSTDAQPPATVQDEVSQPKHELSEPGLSESEPDIDEVDSGLSDAVRLPEQARQFGLLTRADVQAEPSAIPLIHGLISKGQLVMIAGPSGSGKSVFQLHLGAALLNGNEVFKQAIPKRARMLY